MSKSVSTTRRQEKLINDFIQQFDATIDPTKIKDASALLKLQQWVASKKEEVQYSLACAEYDSMERYIAEYDEAIRMRRVRNAVKIQPIFLRW